MDLRHDYSCDHASTDQCKCGVYDALNARAEIERLEKEVERLKGYGIYAVSEAYDRGSKSAWNDAIEAAAALCETKSATHVDVSEPDYYVALGYEYAAEDILAMKRSQE